MQKESTVKELSVLQSYLIEDMARIERMLQTTALAILIVLGVLFGVFVYDQLYLEALAVTLSAVPILIAIAVVRRHNISLASAIIAFDIMLMVTFLATIGQGIRDIGVLAYPSILIIASLIVRGRLWIYLSGTIIVCLGWLVFGELAGIYAPTFPAMNLETMAIAVAIIVMTTFAVRLWGNNLVKSLSIAQQENREREQAEQQLKKLVQELESKNQELDRFTYTVSHDLKSPLITVRGFLGLLEIDIQAGSVERV